MLLARALAALPAVVHAPFWWIMIVLCCGQQKVCISRAGLVLRALCVTNIQGAHICAMDPKGPE